MIDSTICSYSDNLTEWIIAIAAIISSIGVLIGFPSLINNIRTIKKRENQNDIRITTLEDISISQNSIVGKMSEQIDELRIHSERFEANNELLRIANEINKEHLGVIRELMISGESKNDELAKIAELERKINILPFFVKGTGVGSNNSYTYNFRNIGSTASFLNIKSNNLTVVNVRSSVKKGDNIFKNNEIKITTTTVNSTLNIKNIPIEMILYYENLTGNIYKQEITVAGGSIEIKKPVEITDYSNN